MSKTKYLIGAILCSLIFLNQAAAQTGFKTPQAAAKALYAAWKTKNKTKARAVADNKAIEKLFSVKFQPKWKFIGCTDNSESEKGLFSCAFEDPSDSLLAVGFDTFKTKRGWRIRWVSFAAEH